MHAHKTHVTVTEDHELRLSLPPDFPPGEAEVIVLSTRQRPALMPGRVERLDAWIASLPEVPTLPLGAFDREDIYR
jgi:hypothetical protein